jgi:hypothetical protein
MQLSVVMVVAYGQVVVYGQVSLEYQFWSKHIYRSWVPFISSVLSFLLSNLHLD